MGFFNFFKRDISEEEFQEQQKVKRGLEKTRTGFFQNIVNTLTHAQINDDLYDQLEEQLILADVGPACAVRLVDEQFLRIEFTRRRSSLYPKKSEDLDFSGLLANCSDKGFLRSKINFIFHRKKDPSKVEG